MCLDGGNRPATVKKKITTLKRLFQLAVQRGQLEEKFSERELVDLTVAISLMNALNRIAINLRDD